MHRISCASSWFFFTKFYGDARSSKHEITKVIHLANKSPTFYETLNSFYSYLHVNLQTVASRPLNMELYYVKEEN